MPEDLLASPTPGQSQKISRHHPCSTLEKEKDTMPNTEYHIVYFIGTPYLSTSYCRWFRIVTLLQHHTAFGVEPISLRQFLRLLLSNVHARDLVVEILTNEYRAGWWVFCFHAPFFPLHTTLVSFFLFICFINQSIRHD